jgi:hypothetical protein
LLTCKQAVVFDKSERLMDTQRAKYFDRKTWNFLAFLSALFVLVAQNAFAQKVTSLEGK